MLELAETHCEPGSGLPVFSWYAVKEAKYFSFVNSMLSKTLLIMTLPRGSASAFDSIGMNIEALAGAHAAAAARRSICPIRICAPCCWCCRCDMAVIYTGITAVEGYLRFPTVVVVSNSSRVSRAPGKMSVVPSECGCVSQRQSVSQCVVGSMICCEV